MRQSSASICVGAPPCPTVSPSSPLSPPPVSGARNTSGSPIRRWPRRQVSQLPPSKRSAAAKHQASGKKDEALVHRICSELFKTQRLSDATFAEAGASLGETGLIEVIGIIGYYTLIGNTLNTFQVAVPEGVNPPFPE